MSQIPDNQGAIKSSEIFTDSALASLGTSKGEDNLTVLQQLTQLSLDSFFKQGIMAFSLGFLNWNGSVLNFSQDAHANDIYFRVLQTDDATLRTIDVIMKADLSADTANTFQNITLNNNELLYVELTHANLVAGGTLQLENAVGGGSVISGKTVRKVALSSGTGLDQISTLLTGNGSSLFIPICFRHSWTDGSNNYDDLLWCINGSRWEKDTKNMLGSAQAKSIGGAILNFLETSIPAISWDAEVGIQNMNTYNDSTALPVDGTGGTINPNFVFTTTATPSEVLSGANSFVIEKNAVGSMQGHGVSFDVQVYAGYRTNQVVFKCLFSQLSGTYNDGDIKVYIIADPNGTPQVIVPTNNNIGVTTGEMSATFYPFSSVEDYRICFHLTSTNSNTFRVALDDIKLNPIYYTTADSFTGPQPAGTIAAFGGNIDPDGWMICDGRSLSRTAYAELFGSIGTSFGSDDSNTFRLPDFRGSFLRGKAPSINQTFSTGAVNITNETITLPLGTVNRTGIKIRFTTTGGLPAGLSTGTDYWTIYDTATTIKVASSYANALAGSAINLTSVGSGTHTIVQWMDPDATSRTALTVGGATGNNIGSFEDDQLKSHTHTILGQASLSLALGGQITYFSSSSQTGATGGNETRPTNVTVNYIIKLQSDRKNTVLSSVRVEYSANSNTTSATSDTSAFFNGIEGQPMPAISASGGTRNISFLTQIQPTDTMKLQTDYGSGGLYWVDAAALFPKADYPAITILADTNSNNQITNISNLSGIVEGMSISGTDIPASTTITNVDRNTGIVTISNAATGSTAGALLILGSISFGMSLAPAISSSTQGVVTFGAGGAQPDVSWSSLSAWRWRVVKATNNLAVEVITKDNAGVVKMFAGTTVPGGWIECNGQSLLKSAYPELFAAIGTAHGTFDSLHFNVPDMRGVVVRGDTGFSTVNVTPSSISGTNITVAGHPFNRSGIPVQLSGMSMPSPLTAGTDYYVIVVDANTIQLSATRAGALTGTAITITGTNANAITIEQMLDVDYAYALPMTTGATSNTYEESAFGVGAPGAGSYNESGVFLRAIKMKYIIKS